MDVIFFDTKDKKEKSVMQMENFTEPDAQGTLRIMTPNSRKLRATEERLRLLRKRLFVP